MPSNVPVDAKISTLPGFTLPKHLQSTDHKKNHLLNYKNGYAIPAPLGVPVDLKVSDEVLFEELRQNNEKLRFSPRVYTIGHDIAPTKSHGPEKIDYTTSYERQTVLSQKVDDADEFIPNYGIIDKIVLRFSAFLKDPIPEGIKAPLPNLKSTENQEAVIRSVVIDFFLEDDSIRVTEPFVHDSGLPQGTIIRRQMIPKNINIGLGEKVQYFSIQDFDIGKVLNFYGKEFHILNCDKFTEKYMIQNLELPLSLEKRYEAPIDTYLDDRARTKSKLGGKATHESAVLMDDKLRRFIENDRKVLRFYTVWDDRHSLYGEAREFVIHYFLVDDSMEVRECHKANSGRDSFPILIRRQMIPKVVKHLTDLATTTPIGTDLDVAAAKANRNKEEKFYTWKNMNIGTTVNLLGRPFIIYDVDEFTRRFYTEKGWKPESLRRSNIASFEQTKAVVFEHKENKEEVHPRPNLAKLLETQGKQLRFIGQLLHKDDHSLKAPSVPDPKARNFVVCFRLTDEKISIFECLSRNSGFIGGKFCEWTWVKKNGGGFYSGADVYVGAIIEVYRHRFALVNADDFVFKWMSTHLESFPESNVTSTIRKLKSLGVDSNVINSCLQKTIPGQDATPQQILGALKVLPEIESFTDHAILAIGHSLKTGPGNISTKAFADLFN